MTAIITKCSSDYVRRCIESGARIASPLERRVIGMHVCPTCLQEIVDHWSDDYIKAYCHCGEEMTAILTFNPQGMLYLK